MIFDLAGIKAQVATLGDDIGAQIEKEGVEAQFFRDPEGASDDVLDDDTMEYTRAAGEATPVHTCKALVTEAQLRGGDFRAREGERTTYRRVFKVSIPLSDFMPEVRDEIVVPSLGLRLRVFNPNSDALVVTRTMLAEDFEGPSPR